MIKILKVGLYMIIASILIILALELTLRTLGYTYSSSHIMYDKHCYWRMAPKQKMYARDQYENPTIFTINSLGARGGEFPVKKPLGEKRIICVGDSYTYGWGVDDAETYPAHLQKLIDNDGFSMQVINFGCNGHTILHEANLVKKYGLRLNPDHVIVQVSLNTDFQDIDELEYRLGYMPAPGYNFIKYVIRKTAIGHVMLKSWNSKKVKDLIARRKQLKRQKAREVVLEKKEVKERREEEKREVAKRLAEKEEVKVPFDIYIDKLDELVKLSEENNFQIIYVIIPHHTDSLDEYEILSAYLREGATMTARQYYEFIKNRYQDKITIIELMSHFNSKDLFLPDWHLNPKGNQLAAKIIYERFKEILKEDWNQ